MALGGGHTRTGIFAPLSFHLLPTMMQQQHLRCALMKNLKALMKMVAESARLTLVRTQYPNNMLQFVTDYQTMFERTKVFCKRLVDLGVLESGVAQFNLPQGEVGVAWRAVHDQPR